MSEFQNIDNLENGKLLQVAHQSGISNQAPDSSKSKCKKCTKKKKCLRCKMRKKPQRES